MGVYLIFDKKKGKCYVGSASGQGGLWQRWRAYAETGHGGNADLKAVLEENGLGHSDNLQYSVLEIADSQVSDTQLYARENHWKDVLMTRDSATTRTSRQDGAKRPCAVQGVAYRIDGRGS